MRYLITENQINQTILNFIHNEFSDDNIDWSYDYDPDTDDELNRNIINFNGERYRDNETDDYSFVYVKREYYESLEDEEFMYKWINKAPLLDFMDRELENKFNMMFGPYWKPVFEKWFKQTYPEFPVKTFVYKRKK